MALATFDPPLMPSPGTARRWKPNTLKAEFGDGYNQSQPNGLNHLRRTVDLRWNVLTDDQAENIVEFFVAHGASRPFLYQVPRDASPVKWTCEDWTDDVDDAGFRKVAATLIQSFTLES
jgi:phage-related protein